jgi:sulfatase maturation enzyme AslB (radical SAM superfamily)
MENTAASGFVPVRTTGLPVFRRDRGQYAAFYAPGFLAVVNASGADRFESALGDAHTPDLDPVPAALICHAQRALEARATAATAPFEPVCLTLYLGSRCNLHCTYCYASSSRARGSPLDWSAIQAAAPQVLANCERRGAPLTTVFHGGGEPTLFPGLIDRVLDELEPMADSRNVRIFRYLATNGVLPAARAHRLARRFDTIGISCDGPERWQSLQRPTWAGGASTPFVERTAKAVRDEGTPLHVRVTVTSRTLCHQAEITQYICERLAPDEIHVEPLYVGGRAQPETSLRPDQAPAFVDGLLAARQIAAMFGVPLRTSGSRIAELHGPYCNVFRDVLQLVPGGVATTCFKTSTARESDARGTTIGRTNGEVLALEARQITALRRILGAWPGSCGDCFNRFHCSLGCPDSCPLGPQLELASFRCRVQMMLAQRALDDLAALMWKDRGPRRDVTGQEVSPPWQWD